VTRPALRSCAVAGALILGKTDTVEFASGGRKALTRNPYNFAHTPGGSSSGSGAAVGDFQVPLAFGTQDRWLPHQAGVINGIYGIKADLEPAQPRRRANVVDHVGYRRLVRTFSR